MSFFRDIGRILFHNPDNGKRNPPEDMLLQTIDSEASLQAVLDRSEREPVAIFKHSATCPISAMVRRRVMDLSDPADPPVFELVVQTARPIAQKLEQDFGIRHESPQIILIHRHRPTYHTSHSMITTEGIRAAAANATEIE